MYEKLYKRILDASQTNSLIFFVGAGISALSGAPRWSELIDKFAEQIGEADKNKNYSTSDYLAIPQKYFYSIDENNDLYYSKINSWFNNDNLNTNCIHDMLLSFNPRSFITTNFDNLIESAASKQCQGFKVIASDEEVSQITGNRYILKIHGDLEHKNIVLKEEDYLNYSENFMLIETLLKSIFATETVVFIGYGLNDYNTLEN